MAVIRIENIIQTNILYNTCYYLRHDKLRSMIELLLRRGADPNKSAVPFLALMFAVKAGDSDAVRLLLEKGASPNIRLSDKVL